MRTTPFDYSNHPTIVRYMFEGGNATGYKILYVLSCCGKGLYNIQEIANMCHISKGGASTELRRLLEKGYLFMAKNQYYISQARVQDSEQLNSKVQDSEQKVQDVEQKVQDPESLSYYSNIVNNNINNFLEAEPKKQAKEIITSIEEGKLFGIPVTKVLASTVTISKAEIDKTVAGWLYGTVEKDSEFAMKHLKPLEASIIEDSRYVHTMRRPLKKYPQIWITELELKNVLEACNAKQVEARTLFQMVDVYITQKKSEGMDERRIHAVPALTGWAFERCMTQSVLETKKENQEAFRK